jgi:hypothetical protein
MDLLIGGVPRSGTTALARSAGLLDDVFCWETESQFIKTTFDMAGLLARSLVPPHRKRLEEHLFNAFASSMLRMRKDLATRHEQPLMMLGEDDIRRFAGDVSDVLMGTSAAEMHHALLGTLRQLLAARSPTAALLAEKSPSNVMYVDTLKKMGIACIFTYRNPDEVVSSMAARVGRDADAYIFDISYLERIGMYYRHARHLVELPDLGQLRSGSPRVFRVSYQRLMTDPVGSMANVSYLIGRDITTRQGKKIVDIMGDPGYKPKPVNSKRCENSPGLQSPLLYRLLRSLFADEMRGAATSDFRMDDQSWKFAEGIYPYWGLYSPDSRSRNGRWCELEFEFVILAENNKRHANLRFYGAMNDTILGTDRQEIVVKDVGAGTGSAAVHTEVIQNGTSATLRIPLVALTPLCGSEHFSLYQLNFSIFPYSLPYIFSETSGDERTMSMIFSGAELE